ncbi:hypothetical protein [Candidatus Mycolicibacterium alkanivorans]|uniref:Uncharacterized protein n=1 Tax=Candidatus Mycolicibacterium alkanivorans TaxID=2954114 RepID=A0ABS9YTF4_9MYCO|nr:hypothetical protein [Candidatus Mycolicibacterium alkanivorans]MCI4674480.1 hypothetical protein [Candidatus Mycolicibacterium alkanivorans]
MTALIAILLLTVVLLAPVGVVAAIASVAHRDGTLRLHIGQFRVGAPLVGRLYDDGYDADARRVEHDLDAVRTRFEEHPVWPSPGVLGERR